MLTTFQRKKKKVLSTKQTLFLQIFSTSASFCIFFNFLLEFLTDFPHVSPNFLSNITHFPFIFSPDFPQSDSTKLSTRVYIFLPNLPWSEWFLYNIFPPNSTKISGKCTKLRHINNSLSLIDIFTVSSV